MHDQSKRTDLSGCGLPLYIVNFVPQNETILMKSSYRVISDAEFFQAQ